MKYYTQKELTELLSPGDKVVWHHKKRPDTIETFEGIGRRCDHWPNPDCSKNCSGWMLNFKGHEDGCITYGHKTDIIKIMSKEIDDILPEDYFSI